MASTFRVLGCDPGRINFGWAVYGDEGLEEHGSLEGAEDISRLDAAGAFFEQLLQKKRPDACCIERFQQRPGKGMVGNMEVVNLMIGQCRATCKLYRIPVALVTASMHKGWLSRNFEVQQLTHQRKGVISKKFDLKSYCEWQGIKSEHEVDAANIAKYGHDVALVTSRTSKS